MSFDSQDLEHAETGASINEAPAADGAPDVYSFDHSATYSPEDNKLRIYPGYRLPRDVYDRVKAAGFSWAPKQELFVAPMWTPAREDLARELCGEIGDEDTTLAERAEDRADRFEGYRERRAGEAQSALDHVHAIAGRFEAGQPILVGHHSERKARKDAERMEAGMRRAVDCWETAGYWKRRAAGAIRAAKYKELPAVRARRIKGLEADQRKHERERAECERFARIWTRVSSLEWDRQTEAATMVAGRTPAGVPSGGLYSDLHAGRMHGDCAWRLALEALARSIAWHDRWLSHLANRLEYERAMLDEAGGVKAAAWDLQPGGTITHRGRRSVISRVNRKDGAAVSVSVIGQGWTVGLEEITAYDPPSEAAAAAVAKVTKLAPLVNYERPGCVRMTQAQFMEAYKDYRGTITIPADETTAAHRVRCVDNFIARKHGATGLQQWGRTAVFLTDAKLTPAPALNAAPKRASMARKIAAAHGIDTTGGEDPPPPVAGITKDEARRVLAEETAPGLLEMAAEADRLQRASEAREADKAEAAPFEAMRQALKDGTAVQVVSAPQLFPTPAHVAARMVELAGLQDMRQGPPLRIAEPSAGTGALLQALRDAGAFTWATVHAWEIVPKLADRLRAKFPGAIVRAFDFLQFDPNPAELFGAVLMNPPFANADDVRHILHARRFLTPGGRLVAICAAGPRQHEALQPLADSWEYLPAGTFDGTGVRTVLLTMGAE